MGSGTSKTAERPACRQAEPAPRRRPASTRRRITGWRKWALRLVLAVAAPLLVVTLLETCLYLAGYGENTDFFVKIAGREAHTANPKFTWQFYHRRHASAVHPFSIAATKPPGTIRIFILGGSAAWGTPEPAFNFGRILEVMLRQQYPRARFEVANVAIMGINSHVVRAIARECAAYDPDLFIVYLGNNEVIGLYGPETDTGGTNPPSLPVIRAGLWAKSTRIGQLLGNLLREDGEADRALEAQDDAFFRRHRVALDDPRREAVYTNFAANLEDICEAAGGAGGAAVLSTVAVNLRDCPPFGSLHRPDLSPADREQWEALYEAAITAECELRFDEAVAGYRKAGKIDDRHAELHFRLGRCLLACQRPEEARRHFELARDLDANQFRADGRMNETVRRVAGQKQSEGVVLADAERALAASDLSTDGIPGQALFYEHVHLKFAGNYELARTLYPAVCRALGKKLGTADGGGDLPSREECARQLGLSKWLEFRMDAPMVDLTSQPPSTLQLEHAARQRRAEAALRRFQGSIRDADHGRAVAACREAIEGWPDDWQLHYNLGMLYYLNDDDAPAAEQMRIVLETFPQNLEMRLSLGHCLARLGKIEEAVAVYRRALEVERSPEDVARVEGFVCAAKGRYRQAVEHFERVLQTQPDAKDARSALEAVRPMAQRTSGRTVRILPAAAACFQRGEKHVERGELAEAVEDFRMAVQLNPEVPQFRSRLGTTLLEEGRAEEAVVQLSEAARLQPNSGAAHYLLGQALARQGRTGAAIDHFRLARELGEHSPGLNNHLAWLLATAAAADLRNGPQAVELAEQASRDSGRPTAAVLDTLAAAYAEAGCFEKAVATAGEALRLASAGRDQRFAAALKHRLGLYRQRQAYHQSP